MFAIACAQAQQFTRPVIVSFKKYNGECGSMIGTYVIINNEGYIITAYHIIEQLLQFKQSQDTYNDLVSQRSVIEANANLKGYQKESQLKKIPIPADMITTFSIWWGWNNVHLNGGSSIPDADIAVGQLVGYDSNSVNVYPQFKDPDKPMDIGTSLCKLGFPFHSITPTYDEQNKSFNLPAGALPIPFFASDGIFTRNVAINTALQKNYPISFLETSNPGLRGQSGGPTFDVHGSIWAIQSRTSHLKLGFDGGNNPNLTHKEIEHLKNQYLHVGWGTHSETIVGFLKELNINFNISAY